MPPGTGKPDQSHTRLFGLPDSQCRSRRDGHQATDSNTGAFLHHFEAGATGNQRKAVAKSGLATTPYSRTDQFIQSIVTTDIFPNQFDAALVIAPGCSVSGTGLFLQRLVTPKIAQSLLHTVIIR